MMAMIKKLLIPALFVLILSATLVGSALAQTTVPQPGVQVGNEVKYKLTFYWNSTTPGATPPSSWVDQNNTDYYQATVTSVMETLVELQTDWHFKNGTDITNTEQVDVSTGNGGSILVYASNLTAGSSLYPLASYPWIISETTTHAYSSGATRLTNHITENRTDLGTDYVYSYVSLYFDQKTGFLVDAYLEDVYTATPDQVFARQITIQESNAWTVPEFPSLITVTLLMAATFTAVVVYKTKYATTKQATLA
jgi:hypothetical protein